MSINRRDLLGLAAGVGGALNLGVSAEARAQDVIRARQPGQIPEGRIDFHQHIMPPGYADWLDQRVKVTYPQPKWTPEAAIAANDALGNQGAYLSVSSPGIQFGNLKESREYARRCNEYTAKVSSDRPDRLGWSAVMVLPDVEGSIAEAVYALDVLKAAKQSCSFIPPICGTRFTWTSQRHRFSTFCSIPPELPSTWRSDRFQRAIPISRSF